MEPPDAVRQLLGARADPVLRDLEREARARGVPVLGAGAGSFVAALARARGGSSLLDLGAGLGYASFFLGRVAREAGGRVVAVERDAALAAEARGWLAKAGLDGVVEVRAQDALAALQEQERWELILLGIDEAEHAAALPACIERLAPRGVLVADRAAGPRTSEAASLALGDDRLDATLLHGYWAGHAPPWDTLLVAVRKASGTGTRAGPLG